MSKLLLTDPRPLIAAAAIFVATPATAAEITVMPPHRTITSTFVYVTGKIFWWDALVFKKLTEALKGDVVVSLNSPGGHCAGGISMGSFIRMNQWTTSVGFDNMCTSACALIWFGGFYRTLGANVRVGVHSASDKYGTGERSDEGNDRIAAYLRSIDIPEEVIERWRKTDPREMDFINYQQARSLGLLNGPPVKKDGGESYHPKRPFMWHLMEKPPLDLIGAVPHY